MITSHLPIATPALVQAVGALQGFSALLTCVDPGKWNSLGRPQVEDLAALSLTVQSNLTEALADVVILPEA